MAQLFRIGFFVFLSSVSAQAQEVASAAQPDASGAGTAQPARRDSVYINPEVRPAFVGGMPAMGAYIAKNMRYPEQALRQRVGGRVLVSFVVGPEGRIQDVQVVKGAGAGLDDEARRLVWMMPAWQPGQEKGQPVRTACTIPIVFQP